MAKGLYTLELTLTDPDDNSQYTQTVDGVSRHYHEVNEFVVVSADGGRRFDSCEVEDYRVVGAP